MTDYDEPGGQVDGKVLTSPTRQAHDLPVAAHQRYGFGSPELLADTAESGFFTSVAWRPVSGGRVGHRKMRRFQYPVFQPARSPSRLEAGWRFINRYWSPAMSQSHGADPRQSRTLQRLDHFEPAGVTALAAAGLVLSDALNRACFVINPALPMDLAGAAGALLDGLFGLQDAVFGSADQIPAALAAFLAVAESEVFRG